MAVHYKKRILNREGQYERPMVIISNHQSFIDILVTSMLSPKVVLLTNRWVWNSPIFGWVVKMADFYPVDFGIEDSVEPLSKMVKQGYSIMVFPEGSRQFDGEIKRFHKGAFYLAEKLQLDVMPLLIHGSGDCIRKNDLNMHYATLTMKFLAPIRYDDASYGDSYSERAKNIGHYFRQEYKKLREEVETPKSLRHKLISNFLYKGPVLEWYMRIKIRLENYYEPFHQLIPRQASILDLGCGYGFMSYMLHFLSAERVITGVDYDEEKIEVAQHGYLRGENLSFIHADITTYAIGKHDAIIISDVLHYLSPVQQEDMLQKCYDNLNAGGIIILRDGDQDIKQKHGTTRLTEFFSIKLLNFNRSNQPLNFISGEKIKQWAQRTGMEIERVGNQKLTSNVIFALRKK
jgi:1-acyl-sn-glycerol-3-phosphate acyltransferase